MGTTWRLMRLLVSALAAGLLVAGLLGGAYHVRSVEQEQTLLGDGVAVSSSAQTASDNKLLHWHFHFHWPHIHIHWPWHHHIHLKSVLSRIARGFEKDVKKVEHWVE